MNLYLLLTINCLIIGFLTFFIVDYSREFTRYKTEPLCSLNEYKQTLCAECYRRNPDLLPGRAFKIQSQQLISVLKIKDGQNYLSCYDYLQLVNTSKDSNIQKEIQFQAITAISEIVSEIDALLQPKKASLGHLVQPWYSQFVIYRWGEPNTADIQVMYPNAQNFKTVNFYFLYGFNFLLLILLIAWLADKTFLVQQTTPLQLCLGGIALLLELYFLDINKEVCLYLCRLLVLNIELLRLKVDNFKVLLCLLVGLFMTYFEVTLSFYIIAVSVLVFYCGKAQPESNDTQRYVISLYILLLLNHAYLYQYTQYLNDSRNLVIDLCLIIMIPLGLFLLPNQKKFRPYHPVDPQIRSIYLSGYDDEESATM